MNNERTQWGLPLAALLLALLVAAVFCGTLYFHRDMIFDDAFITYRYAKNTADGHGSTWNPGEPPTEGYTNFLFVMILAPFIKMGLDPLAAARGISLLAAMGLFFLCFLLGRMREGLSRLQALLAALAFIAGTRTDLLIMLGLETVLYAFLLGLSFLFAVRYINNRSSRAAAAIGISSLLAILLSLTAFFSRRWPAWFFFLPCRTEKRCLGSLPGYGH